MKRKFVWVCVVFLLVEIAPVFGAPPIANSVNEFSGTQGQGNWYYGYYNGNSSAPYSNADFEQLPYYGSGGNGLPEWYSNMWYLARSLYWTALWNEGGHPNGLITSGGRLSAEHWAVRRWVSEVNGSVTIAGNLADLDGSAGDGIVGHIIIDGTDVFTQISDGESINYNINAIVTVGSLVDFAIAPRSSDWTDNTRFTCIITPEPATLLLLGLGGLGLLKKRRA